MTMDEALEINGRVGNMILTFQREFWADYRFESWKNTKTGKLYQELCKQRDDLGDYLFTQIKE
jgi:hypothetical protein